MILTLATQASKKLLAPSQSQKTFDWAHAPSGSVDCTSLSRRPIELELAVANNGTDSTLFIDEDPVVKGHGELFGSIADG
jgi:hypothetical protein